MSLFRSRIGVFLPVAGFLVVALLTGCADDGRSTVQPIYSGGGGDGDGPSVVKREKLPTNGFAENWEGTILFEGTPPTPKNLNINKQENICHSPAAEKDGDTVEHVWIVDKESKGIKNALVFLEPKLNKYYFDIRPEDKDAGKVVKMDQPHCAYRPHVVAYFSTFYDEEADDGYLWTKEKLEIFNTSPTAHNIKFIGISPIVPYQPPSNLNLNSDPTGTSPATVKIWHQDTPIQVTCDIHPWMSGLIWSFDHPYFAVTDEKGKFKMPYVPAGQEVRVVVWHEALPNGGFLNNGDFKGREGKLVTFSKDSNKSLNLKISN